MRKTTKRKPAKKAPKPATVLVLRTCDKDMKSHGGFQWPTSGEVVATDWDAKPQCENGLHGALWGEGGILANVKYKVENRKLVKA